jgi:hypothetical protein
MIIFSIQLFFPLFTSGTLKIYERTIARARIEFSGRLPAATRLNLKLVVRASAVSMLC